MLAYATVRLSEEKKDSINARASLYRIMHETVVGGCPVFTVPSAIVVSGDNPKAMRRQLDRVVQDIEDFEVQLSKIKK